MTRRLLCIGVAIWLALLTGCAGLSPREPADRRSDAAWALEGRLAVRTADDGWHASLRWRQRQDHFAILLSGPLGQGALRLTGDAEGVTLTRADGRVSRARDPAILLHQETGWQLPVAGLRYWVRGRVQPGVAYRLDRDPQGRPAELAQAGWRIEFTDYFGDDAMALPRRIALQHEAVRVKLIIDHWEDTAGQNAAAPAPVR